MIVKKVWGQERILCNEPEYCAKILDLNGGYACSLHYHLKKTETFIVQSGCVTLEQRDVRGVPIVEVLLEGNSRKIMPKTPHRFSSRLGATILEISTHHEDSDVVRIEDSKQL